MKLIWKIIRQHLSISQLISFLLANIIGLTIICLALQLYQDIKPAFDTQSGIIKPDFLIVSKPVSTLRTIIGSKPDFSEKEINELQSQSFVEQIGQFTPALYNVEASFDASSLGVYLATELFFESVPDQFVDVNSNRWHYEVGQKEIPIIIPYDYLNLYNFGFAQSADLPTISESIINNITFTIIASGNGLTQEFTGRIIGFSNRLNTILVPNDFIQWSNNKFAPHSHHRPSRLIVQVANPTDAQITQYCQEKGYNIDQNKLDNSKTKWLLDIVMSIVITIGIIITLLSCYILVLSISILIQKSKQHLQDLMLLGYRRKQIAMPYNILIITANTLSFVSAYCLTLIARNIYQHHLTTLLQVSGSTASTALIAVTISLLLNILNIIIINRQIHRDL